MQLRLTQNPVRIVIRSTITYSIDSKKNEELPTLPHRPTINTDEFSIFFLFENDVHQQLHQTSIQIDLSHQNTIVRNIDVNQAQFKHPS